APSAGGSFSARLTVSDNNPASTTLSAALGGQAVGPGGGGNLLSSGSFENGRADGWTVRLAGTNRAVYSDPSYAKEGSGYLAMNNGSVAISSAPSIYQDVPVAAGPGQSYTCSIWVRSRSGQPYSGTLALWGLGG